MSRLGYGLAAVGVLAGCRPEPETIGGLPQTTEAATTTSSTSGGEDTQTVSTQTSESTGVSGVTVTIRVRATADPFSHDDDWSGQTARDFFAGIRSLTLIDESGRHDDLRVFDFAPGHVEASWNEGDETTLAVVPAEALTYGTYTRARVGVSHLRFTVDTTVHALGLVAPGEVVATQVLSDHTTLDGQTHDRGWWRYVFHFAGMQFPLGGEDGAPVTQPPPGGAIEVVVEGSETAVYFPTSLLVDPTVQNDVNAVLEVNMHESFRWEDQDEPDFAPGVFDASPPSFEPIRQIGVNHYSLRFE